MSSIELATVTQAHSETNIYRTESREATILPTSATEDGLEDAAHIEQGLAPVDGGLAAWKLLCAAFMFEALLWGELSSHYTRLSMNDINNK